MALTAEKLIETVKGHPVIYDVADADYKNNRVKNMTWHAIAEELGKKNGEILKKQWKNLRDAYSKHLRSLKEIDESSRYVERYRTWPWAKHMAFLRPHLEYAESNSLQRSTERSLIIQRFAEEYPEAVHDNTSKESCSNENNEEDVDGPPTTPPQETTRRKRKLEKEQPKKNKKIVTLKEKVDETDLLFKSYSKKLKKMNMRRQARVKFEIAKIMLNAELEECNEQSRPDGQFLDHDMLRQSNTNVQDPVYIVASQQGYEEEYTPPPQTYMPPSPSYISPNPLPNTNLDESQTFTRRQYKEEIDIEIQKEM